jgi:hypothetical protein
MIKFEVIIKPFFNELIIKGMKNMNEEVQEFLYDSLDEWGGFTMFDKKFDYHFLYDEEPKLVMYSYNDKSYDLSDMNVKLIIEI